MKLLFIIFITTIISGCSTSSNELDNSPSIDFDPEMVMSSPSLQSGKVTFKYINAGTDFFVVINNGMKEFLIFDEFSIAGSKCSYSSRTNITVAPISVTTYKLPTIGIIGLCYSNTDQLYFIENKFLNISEKGTDSYLAMYSQVKYHIPGQTASTENKSTKKLFINFAKPSSSMASGAI